MQQANRSFIRNELKKHISSKIIYITNDWHERTLDSSLMKIQILMLETN